MINKGGNSMGNKMKDKKNSGFSLISVLLAVAFVTMLVFAILYLSLVNFRMKQANLKEKNSFYAAEKAMDEIRIGLQEKEGDALSSAYTKVLEAYAATTAEDSLEQRNIMFKKEFTDILVKSLAKQGAGNKVYNLEMLKSFIKVDSLGLKEGEQIKLTSVSNSKMLYSKKNGVLLKGLQVTHLDAKGHASIIRTDIRMSVPEVNFTQSSNMPDLMNMTLVAQEGLTVAGENKITGSLYAGKFPDKAVNDASKENKANYGIYLEPNASLSLSGDRVVTNGTVYADIGATFKCEKDTALWTRNIQALSSDIELLGKAYVADDLTIDTAIGNANDAGYLSGSKVKLSGEYTGYGSKETLNKIINQPIIEFYKDWADSSLESAIIVNGKDTSLDMSALDKIMLAGNSYIGSASKKGDESGSDTIFTGESITVKGNQLAYLVPSECLFAEDGSKDYGNPISYEDYESAMKSNLKEFDPDVPIGKLGGTTLRDLGITSFKKVFQAGPQVVSYYMAFDSEEAASSYFQAYYGNAELKAELDRSLKFYVSEDNGIVINTPDRFLRYITKGNTFSYRTADGGTGGSLLAPQAESGAAKPEEEQANYQNVFYALNKKMISNYSGLKDGTKKDSEGKQERNETKVDSYVFDNMINLDAMKTYIQKNDDEIAPGGIYQFQTSTTNQKAYIVDTKNDKFEPKDDVFHITKELTDSAEPLRLVICNGPVVVDAGVNYKGVILTNSTLKLEKNATVESAPEDVPRVFQSKYKDGTNLSAEEKRPMDFFWDNTQYIINGAASGGGAQKVQKVLNLDELVTYEKWQKR